MTTPRHDTRRDAGRNTSWSGTRRSFPDAMRRKILRRDPTCQVCHTAPSTQADHIIPAAQCQRQGINPDTLANGQGICTPCHDNKTRREQRDGQARLPKRKRPKPQHPGIIDRETQPARHDRYSEPQGENPTR